MSLLEMQRALSRLLTDEDLREVFFNDASAAFASFDLSPGERACLRGVDKKRVAIHSHLMMHARVERALSPLPLTSRVVRPHADEVAPEYCRRHPPTGITAGGDLAEVRRMIEFLGEHQAATGRWPEYLGDLMRYEECLFRLGQSVPAWASCEHAARVNVGPSSTLTPATAEAFDPLLGAHAEVLTFAHEMVMLAQALEQGQAPSNVPVAPTRLLLFRERGTGAVRAVTLDELPCRLIRHCDGRRSVAEVIGLIAGELGIAGDERVALSHGACDLFRTLWEAGAMAFVAREVRGPAD